jgi:hypothetical protein
MDGQEPLAKFPKYRSVPHDNFEDVTFDQAKSMVSAQTQWYCKSVMDHLPDTRHQFDSSQEQLVMVETLVESMMNKIPKEMPSFCSFDKNIVHANVMQFN